MLASRVLSRVSRSVALRSSLSVASTAAAPARNRIPILFGQFHSLAGEYPCKLAAAELSFSSHLTRGSSALQRFRFSSSASPKSDERENNAKASKTGEAAADKEGSKAKKAEGKRIESVPASKSSNCESDSAETLEITFRNGMGLIFIGIVFLISLVLCFFLLVCFILGCIIIHICFN